MYICSRSWRRQPCGASRLRLHARPGGEGGPTWHAAADWRDMMSGGAALDPRWPGVRAHVAPCPTRHDVFRLRFRLRFRIHPIALLCLCFPPPPFALARLPHGCSCWSDSLPTPRRRRAKTKSKMGLDDGLARSPEHVQETHCCGLRMRRRSPLLVRSGSRAVRPIRRDVHADEQRAVATLCALRQSAVQPAGRLRPCAAGRSLPLALPRPPASCSTALCTSTFST